MGTGISSYNVIGGIVTTYVFYILPSLLLLSLIIFLIFKVHSNPEKLKFGKNWILSNFIGAFVVFFLFILWLLLIK